MTYEREWTTAAGLPARIILTRLGHRCGYVGVDSSHPLHSKSYNEPLAELRTLRDEFLTKPFVGSPIDVICAALAAEGDKPAPSMVYALTVHGGVTFSDHMTNDPDDRWWIGFDCAHVDDTPEEWTEDAVARECESLAEQIARVQPVTA